MSYVHVIALVLSLFLMILNTLTYMSFVSFGIHMFGDRHYNLQRVYLS